MTVTLETLKADFEAALLAYASSMPNKDYWLEFTADDWLRLPIVSVERGPNAAQWNAVAYTARAYQKAAAMAHLAKYADLGL